MMQNYSHLPPSAPKYSAYTSASTHPSPYFSPPDYRDSRHSYNNYLHQLSSDDQISSTATPSSFQPTSFSSLSSDLSQANTLLHSSSINNRAPDQLPLNSHNKAQAFNIKLENEDSRELDDEEDSNEDFSDKEKDCKEDHKTSEGKPPYSYVAMIGIV